MKRKILLVISCILTIIMGSASLWLWLSEDGQEFAAGLEGKTQGSYSAKYPQAPVVGESKTDISAVERGDQGFTIQESGETQKVYQQVNDDGSVAQDRMWVTEDGTWYAPTPEEEFRETQCANPTSTSVPELNFGTFSLPYSAAGGRYWSETKDVVAGFSIDSLGVKNVPIASAAVNANGSLNIPDSPYAIIMAEYAQLNQVGNKVISGHVDTNSGQLAPMGYLHRLNPCETMSIAQANGEVKTYQLVSLYTVKQNEISSSEIYDTSQDAVFMVTCSGPAVGDDGSAYGNLLTYPYTDNLVAKWVEV